MDDLLLRVVERLISIHTTLGPSVYRRAARKALVGIAVAAHGEAQRRAVGKRRRHRNTGRVIRFPLVRARSNQRGDQDPS